MAGIHVQRRIAAPPHTVWSIIIDIEGSPDVISGIDAVDMVHGATFGVGTAWSETRTMFGKQATAEMQVVDVVEGSSYTVESRATGTTYRSTMSVTPDGDGSLLAMSLDAEAGSPITRVFAATIGKLFERGTRKALERDLDDIAGHAEHIG